MWRAEKDFAGGSTGHLQVAGDYEKTSVPYLAFTSPFGNDDWALIRRSFEAEAQHSFRWLQRNRLTWGVNFRRHEHRRQRQRDRGLEPAG